MMLGSSWVVENIRRIPGGDGSDDRLHCGWCTLVACWIHCSCCTIGGTLSKRLLFDEDFDPRETWSVIIECANIHLLVKRPRYDSYLLPHYPADILMMFSCSQQHHPHARGCRQHCYLLNYQRISIGILSNIWSFNGFRMLTSRADTPSAFDRQHCYRLNCQRLSIR